MITVSTDNTGFATDARTDWSSPMILGLLSTPDAVTHPAWCDPARCTVLPDLPLDDGVHLSAALTIEAPITTTGPMAVDVWLHQVPTDDTAYLVVDIGDTARALFPITVATTVADAVTHLLGRTEGNR